MFLSTMDAPAADPQPKSTLLSFFSYLSSTLPATAIRGALRHLWHHYHPQPPSSQQHVAMPPPPLTFIVTLLLAFTGIKSQGQSDFPFITHPLLVRFSINSLVIYGLSYAAELVASPLDRTSVFVTIARLGKFRRTGIKIFKKIDTTTTIKAMTTVHMDPAFLLQLPGHLPILMIG